MLSGIMYPTMKLKEAKQPQEIGAFSFYAGIILQRRKNDKKS